MSFDAFFVVLSDLSQKLALTADCLVDHEFKVEVG